MLRRFGWLTAFAAISCGSPDGADALGELAASVAPAISLEDAIAIATAEVPGDVDEAELEDEGGVSAYSVDVRRDGVEIEVRVDPSTGAILSITEEGEDDGEDADDGEAEDDGEGR